MSDWFNEHDEWVEQFGAFLDGLPSQMGEGMDDNDRMFVSNLAAKVRRGDIGMHNAVHELMKYASAKMGYVAYPDEEAFRLDMQYHDRLEITDDLKELLISIDEPGIADAIIHAFASMMMLDDDSPVDQCMVGLQTKAWFEANKMTQLEDHQFKWAVQEALRKRYG